MTNYKDSKQGSKTRFRFSLFLLTGLMVAKLLGTSGKETFASAPDQTTMRFDGRTRGFSSVDEENDKVWGLAGSLLNVFSGRELTPDERRQEEERKEAHEQANQERWRKEYEERREDERNEKEQKMYDHQDQQRAEEQQRYDQQQKEYYERRQQEQGF